MGSLRVSAGVHNQLVGEFSVVRDYLGFKRLPGTKVLPGPISVKSQMDILEKHEVVHLHIRIVDPDWLTTRTGVVNGLPTVDEMIAAMRRVYGGHGVAVVIQSVTVLNLPAHFRDIDTDADELDDLFDEHANRPENHAVAFFIRAMKPADNGAHPPGSDGCLVSAVASMWTLAHEIGHAMGLDHADDVELIKGLDCATPGCLTKRLMTGCSTSCIVIDPPLLSSDEVSTMKDSDLTLSF